MRSRLAVNEGELVQKLGEMAQMQGWNVSRASKPQEAAGYIRELAASSGAKLVVRSDQQVLDSISLDSSLVQDGVQVTVMARASGLSPEEIRQQESGADIGVTGADYAIAETGSVAVLPRRGLSRLVSLLPPIHVAVVRPREVVESLEDLFVLRRLAYYQEGSDMSSSMYFITGPSRTADIEQTLVIGVHGPKQAHLLLLG